MSSKKRLFILAEFLFLTVFLLGITHAVDSCWVETSASTCTATDGNQVVMHLSDSTNAHGELESQSPNQYSQVLCCNLGSGDTSCSVDNKIIGLSSPTNAHGERPENSNYNSNVCYDGLTSCFSVSGGANCAGAPDELEVLRLSSSTNAHLEGAGGNYDTSICCVVSAPIPPLNPLAFWSDDNFGEIISLDNVVPDFTSVKLVLENSGFSQGTDLDFNISEEEIGPDTSIRTVVGTTDSNGRAVVTWTITSEDLEKATDLDKFYFLVNGNKSGFLALNIIIIDCDTIITCEDYLEQAICESDVCGIANKSVSLPEDFECSDSDIDCFCTYDINECKGAFLSSSAFCGNGVVDFSEGEQCDGNLNGFTCSSFDDFTGGTLVCNAPGTLHECLLDTSQCTGGTSGICGDGNIDTGEQCDGSLDGFTCSNFGDFTGGTILCNDPGTSNECLLDTSQCTGGPGGTEIGTCLITEGSADENGCDDGFLIIKWTGEWTWSEENPGHLDPKGLGLLCEQGGTRVIECPAQIKLPFFGFFNIIITIFLITIIYFVLNVRKNKDD